jgi:formate C-acetyltransferase
MSIEMLDQQSDIRLKTPYHNSPRIQWLRDYYFEGVKRKWNNEYTAWTTDTPWDFQYDELSFYIVPETYAFLPTFRASFNQVARPVKLDPHFWSWSLVERRAWFLKEVMVNYLPREIIPGDLLAGARFNIQTSSCLNKNETRLHDKLVLGKNGSRTLMLWLHDHGFGNAGATSGHLIPDYASILQKGWKGIYSNLEDLYSGFSDQDKNGTKGAQLRAMLIAARLPKDLANAYSQTCQQMITSEQDPERQAELKKMVAINQKVPWEPSSTFWEAIQALWMTHMLVISDENYPGPGVSFGRIDQYLYPFWRFSMENGMPRDFGKEILKCFWIHCNTAYDAMIRTGGNQGITAGYGQLFTLAGMDSEGNDCANDLTYAILEVIDEMSPILEPKPNIRLHRNTPEVLFDRVIDMIAASQGAPFLLNFDERSMAGMLRQAKKSGTDHLINLENVHEYAPVGCLENTMVGNDRSGTVDCNLNLLKAVELVLARGYDLIPRSDPMTGKTEKPQRWGPDTGDPTQFMVWEDFWQAYETQTRFIIGKIVEVYEKSESIRADFAPTPYLSCLVKGCAENGLDVTQGGAQLSFVTIEAVTFATTVDSLLAVKYLVYDNNFCSMDQLISALRNNWEGHEVLQARAINKAPKYGRDDDAADAMARQVMELWSEETWKYKTKSTDRQFRPGMLSWNYWISDGFILAASPDGRPKGKFLSNAICPSNGADIFGPTANVNSVGKVIGGKSENGDWQEFVNLLPNGSSHTMTFNPSLLKDAEHKEKFKAFLKSYTENGGTALQINMIDAEMLRDAQNNPQNYRHLLVRVTGYNAYFTTIGKELQNEIILRESHNL